jgi:uncharacterized protein YlxW (UPF0749 family)
MRLIITYWKLGVIIVITVIFLSMLGYIEHLKSSYEVLEKEKVVLNQELDISKQSVKDLSSALERQNKAIDDMKKDSDIRQKKYLEDISKAKKNSAGLKSQADDLMKRALSQNENACNAANLLFIEEISNAKKK